MFTKVLVITDLSPASNEMIDNLEGLQSLGTKDLLLVRCFNLRHAGTLGEQLMKEAEEPLAKQCDKLKKTGFYVKTKVVRGLPQTEINRIASEENCSLIVVGEQRHTLAGEILFEEIAGVVTHYADRPVLVMRLHPTSAKKSHPMTMEKDLLRHILFPTDFSENARHAFSILTKSVNLGVRKVTLMHVQNTLYLHDVELAKETLDQFTETAKERMNKMKQDLLQTGVQDVSVELLYGTSPKREILNRINQGDISMVLIGSQGHGFFSELFLGSVSHAVARHSEAPTLLIPIANSNNPGE